MTVRQRLERVRATLPQVLQTALAAAAAWLVSTEALGHRTPFFAPIAAVISLGITYGQRTRRAIEMAVGVAVGILVADALVVWIGTGTAQIALFVFLAMAVAIMLGGGPMLVTQAATSAALVASLRLPGDELSLTRFLDCLVGGAVALVVNLLLFPANPAQLARRAGDPLLRELAAALDDIAAALDARDVDAAERALERARGTSPLVARFGEAVDVGGETARYAPPRRRHRDTLDRYAAGAQQVAFAAGNIRVLARAVVRALDLDENVPPEAARSIRELGEAVRRLPASLERPDGDEAVRAREAAIGAAVTATLVLEQTGNMAVNVIVGQVRSTAVDLLRALGVREDDAVAQVRAAADAAAPG